MACLTPLKGFLIGKTDNGSNKLKITSWNVDHVDYKDEKTAYPILSKDDLTPKGWYRAEKFIEIPCGQCLGCRQQRSREWANRLMCEAKYHDENWFLTLTYNDDTVPISEYISEDGEFRQALTLDVKDTQDFWKRLRKEIEPEKIRYFLAGEYGDTTARPHYHAIVFGLHIPDLCYYKTVNNYMYFTSQWLNSIWTKGNIIIASVQWASCAYVAQYVTKKLNGDMAKEVYGKLNIVPPFSCMSRRPGIGRLYYEDHVKPMDRESMYINVSTPDGGVKFKRPRYYKKLDLENDPVPTDLSELANFEELLDVEKFDNMACENTRNRDIIELSTDDYRHHLEAKQREAIAKLQKRKEI